MKNDIIKEIDYKNLIVKFKLFSKVDEYTIYKFKNKEQMKEFINRLTIKS